ncbi:hypothetical protein C8J56DRAFT_1050686 [Mycena floridula]|nr:hypothetical protein C8J56DRAFT_1050686 [Mycena floridula]
MSALSSTVVSQLIYRRQFLTYPIRYPPQEAAFRARSRPCFYVAESTSKSYWTFIQTSTFSIPILVFLEKSCIIIVLASLEAADGDINILRSDWVAPSNKCICPPQHTAYFSGRSSSVSPGRRSMETTVKTKLFETNDEFGLSWGTGKDRGQGSVFKGPMFFMMFLNEVLVLKFCSDRVPCFALDGKTYKSVSTPLFSSVGLVFGKTYDRCRLLIP